MKKKDAEKLATAITQHAKDNNIPTKKRKRPKKD